MKKTTLWKSFFLLFALIVGSTNAWATEKKITLNYNSFSLTTTYSTKTATVSGFSFTVNQGYKGTGNVIQMNSSKGSGILYNTTAIEGLKSVKVNVSSMGSNASYSVKTGTSQNPTSNASSGNTTTKTFDAQSGDKYFEIKVTNANYFTSIEITYDEPDADQVATPGISIPTATPFVTSKVVTMNCTTEGASIYYTMTTDGSTPADPTTSSTLYDDSNKPTITSTTKFKAIAVKANMTNSSVGSATFTKETVYEGISALNAVITSTETSYYVRLTDAQITYVESSDAGNAFLNDATAGIYLYTTDTYTLNTKYNGIYKCKTKTSNNWARITKFEEIEDCSSEVAAAMEPVEMTASDLEENFATNVSRQIKITNYTLPNTANKLTTNISLYSIYHDDLVKNKTYTLIGYPTWYNTGKQFRVVEAYIKPETPSFTPGTNTEFNGEITVSLACETEEVTMYYTTDGNAPTTSSTVYNSETGIVISGVTADVTIKAIAVKDGMVSDVASATYAYKAVAKPYFSPVTESALFYGETVSIATATAGEVSIYYTTDGTNPTAESTKYTAPVAITADNTTLKAIAVKGEDVSSIGEATYTIKDPEAPTFTVEEGAVPRNTVVTINSREGTTIYYTTDGTDADQGTDAGSNSVNITIDEGKTIKAIAVDPLLNISTEAEATYTIAQVVKPVFSVAAGVVTMGTQVTITSTTEGATIYYTLDGTTPTSSSNIYNGYVVIAKDETIKAIAIKENYVDSEVASVAYTVAGENEGIVFGNLGYETGSDLSTINGTDVTLTFAKNTGSNGPKYYTGSNGAPNTARIYDKNTLAVSSSANIAAIVLSIYEGSSNIALKTGESGTFAGGATKIWTADAGASTKSVTFLASGTVKIVSVTVFFEATGESATIGTSKLAGFCSEYAHNFSSTGLTAYKAKVNEGQVVLSPVTDGIVPAYTGVVLNGDADDYEIPFATTDATTDFSDNEMVGVTQRTQVLWNPSDGVYNYILQQGQFNKATTGYLKPNRAYLSTSYNVNAAGARPLTIVFEGETTRISNVNANDNFDDNAPMYNLAGQKVGKSYKGIVIQNGKKILKK